jgi:hypothetical protein
MIDQMSHLSMVLEEDCGIHEKIQQCYLKHSRLRLLPR